MEHSVCANMENGRQKRSFEVVESETTPPPAKKAKVDPSQANNAKNAVSILNELRPGLKYVCLGQSGPSHAPVFNMSVEVDGKMYSGVGGSKKAAKCKAAEEALKSFIQLPNNASIVYGAGTERNHGDFTSDAFETNLTKQIATKKAVVKGPTMLLNELYPNASYVCQENENSPYARFKITTIVGNEHFVGTGSSKKLAKNAAAAAALVKLGDFKNVNSDGTQRPSVPPEDQERANYIGNLVQEKFASLMANDPAHIKRKVLAGIVLTRNNVLADTTLICATTGTKCVSGEYISMSGCVMNDMHAEIIARRCLLSYCYDQLELIADGRGESSIFEARVDRRGYRLKPGLEFHLYINTAPCGDARIFSPHEDDEPVDKHPKRSSRGQLRTKIESGEGTIPVKANATPIQTWDGIVQGERLLTMSCSDKICRWNVVGLQGALLSYFIEPIYLRSVILGSLMREAHMHRALYQRVETHLQGLPPPYRLNRPLTYLTTSLETRQPSKAPSFAVAWCDGDAKPEIINTTDGKPENGVSKFCKRALMRRFIGLAGKIRSTTDATVGENRTYGELKGAVVAYKVAKDSLNKAFVKGGFGNWIAKPMEQDMFEINREDS